MLRLRTLGSVSLEADGRPLTGRSTQRRRLALLALLAVARERGMTRDKVLGFLWPDRDQETARHTLSQTLYAIHRELGDEAVVCGVDDLRLNATVVTSDVGEFEEALRAGNREHAALVYGGPFLDGFFVSGAPAFERWADGERQRLATAYGAALVALAEEARSRGQNARAVEWWRKRAALEPLNSHIALRLMSALADAGDRAGAIRHAGVHAALLNQELDVMPDPAVTALADRLRLETAPRADVRPSPEAASAPTPSSAPAHPPRRHTRRWRLAVAGATALVAVALAGVIGSARNHDPGPGAARPLVLGTILGPDPTLGLALREALRAELESGGDVRVVSESYTRETLQLMRRAPDTVVTTLLALEIAQRRGVPLVLVGSAIPLGTGAQLVAQLLDANTGEPLATLTERPRDAQDVVPAVARLAKALRGHAVGTGDAKVTPPLPPVTTASLAALRNYASARQALVQLDRQAAITLLEAAIAHDSLFALAHYLVGDALWYVDQYSHGVTHLTTALRLSVRLPPRERLIVRARYEQLVRDRVDSALAYWQQLRASYPDEPLAYEGLAWVNLALERAADLAALAETALTINPISRDLIRFRYAALALIGDTAGAMRFARAALPLVPAAELQARLAILERRGEWEEALRLVDSVYPPLPGGQPNRELAPERHLFLLALGRLEEGRRQMETVVQHYGVQFPPRAWLFQAHGELGWRGASARVRTLVRRGLAWIEGADIYPPAIARLAELAVTAAARVGDTTAISAARRLVLARDAGRGLHSYRVALLTIDACAAFARGDMRRAADLAARSRPETFHGRSGTAGPAVTLLEADARAAFGDRVGADSLYREVAEVGSVWQPFARRALERR